MGNTPLVSIIVPIYNVEKYIVKVVDSLCNQDYRSIEIILVDDGSPDNSSIIIDDLALKDDRIKVIHKKNGGVSSARNVGLSMTKGKYIMFVDGDDWVEPTYVSFFVNMVDESNYALGMNRNYYDDSGMTKVDSDNFMIIDKNKTAESIYNGDIFVAVWNKIYRKQFLEDNNIRFNEEIWFGEGMLFNIECLKFTNEIAVCEKSLYHQTPNQESAMRAFNLNSFFCGIKSMEMQKQIIDSFSESVKKAWELHIYGYNRSIIDGLIKTNAVNKHKAVYKKYVKQLRRNIAIPMKYEKRFKTKIVWLLYFIFPSIISNLMIKRGNRLIKRPAMKSQV